jgi:hypothetical protein
MAKSKITKKSSSTSGFSFTFTKDSILLAVIALAIGIGGTYAVLHSSADPAPRVTSACYTVPATVTVGGSYFIYATNLPVSSTIGAYQNSATGFDWYYGINNSNNTSPYPIVGHPVSAAGHYTVSINDRVHSKVKTLASCGFDAL